MHIHFQDIWSGSLRKSWRSNSVYPEHSVVSNYCMTMPILILCYPLLVGSCWIFRIWNFIRKEDDLVLSLDPPKHFDANQTCLGFTDIRTYLGYSAAEVAGHLFDFREKLQIKNSVRTIEYSSRRNCYPAISDESILLINNLQKLRNF